MGGKQLGFTDYEQTMAKKRAPTEAKGRAWRSH